MADLFSTDKNVRAGAGAAVFSEGGAGVARVYIDNDLPHLDKLFDYAVPSEMSVSPGMLVRVRFAGKLTNAWVVELSDDSDFRGRLSSIERVISPIPLISETMFTLAQDLSQRHAVSVVKILNAMVPARHAGAEKKVLAKAASVTPVFNRIAADSPLRWSDYSGGEAFARALSDGEKLRVVWQLLPTDFPPRDYYQGSCLIAAVKTYVRARPQETLLVIMPTIREVMWLKNSLEQPIATADSVTTNAISVPNESFLGITLETITSDDSAATRYEKFLRAKAGEYQVIIGTRSLAYQPVEKLSGILIFDDAEQRHQDQQTPYLSSFDIALRRAHLEKTSLIIASAAPSLQALALVDSGWAQLVAAHPQAVRANTAVIEVVDEFTRAQAGSAGQGRLPAFLQTKIRKSLLKGSVLISVPRRGWISIIRCEQCRKTGVCNRCNGPIRVSEKGELSCAWCSDPQYSWKCSSCAGSSWIPTRLGAQRTFTELGRAFPKTTLIHTDAQHPMETLNPHESVLVVSTPGSEPLIPGGYQLIVILDADTVTARPELWALEEAMRRWMRLLGLARANGNLAILGLSDANFAQALIRRDPLSWAKTALNDRKTVNFYPAACLIAVDGADAAITEFLQHLNQQLGSKPWQAEYQLLGVAPRVGPQVPKAFGANPRRALLRISWAHALELLQLLRTVQINHSLRKRGLVTIRVNPKDLL